MDTHFPRSPIGEAVRYALLRWSALNRYTAHGFLDIANNAAQRELRAVATCKAHQVEP